MKKIKIYCYFIIIKNKNHIHRNWCKKHLYYCTEQFDDPHYHHYHFKCSKNTSQSMYIYEKEWSI